MLKVLVPLVVEQRLARLALNRLALQQHAGHEVHLLAMAVQYFVGAVVRVLHDARHLVVDALGRLLRVVLRVAVVAAQEHLVVRLAEHLCAQLGAHAVLRDDGAGHLRGALEVVARARGDVVAEDLLGHATAHEYGQLVAHLAERVEHLVLLGDGQRVAERPSARDDADLVHGIGMRQQVADEGVAALVVGDGVLGLLVHHATLALRAGDDALHRLRHLLLRDDLLAAPRRQKRALVHEVGQIGTREARRELGHLRQIHIAAERLVLGMHLQDLLAALHVRRVHHDLAVEAAGTQKRRVEHVGAVRGGDEHHRVVRLEAVHLHEQLVERLLALVVAAAQARAALATHRVDLVDEDDGRRGLFGLLEQVAHAACAHAHEHLHEVGAGNAEERHARLAGHGLRQKRLAGARRAHEQAAARDLRAHGLVLRRIRQEVLDLLHLLDRFVHARHVGELHVRTLLDVLLGLRLAEAHLRVVRLLHLREEEEQHERDQGDGQKRADDVEEGAGKLHLVGDVRMRGHEVADGAAVVRGRVVARLAERLRVNAGRAHAGKRLARIGVLDGGHARVERLERVVERVGGGRTCGDGRVVRAGHRVVSGAVHHFRHPILLDGLHELGRDQAVGLRGARRRHGHELLPHEEGHDHEQDDRNDGRPRIRLLELRLFVLLCHKSLTSFSAGACGVGRSPRRAVRRPPRLPLPRTPTEPRACVKPPLVHLRLQDADVGQVAVAFREVQPVAHDELVGALEANVCAIDLRLGARPLPQKRGHLKGGRTARSQVFQQVRQGEAGIEDVLGDDDMATLDLGGQVLQDAHDAGAFRPVAVRRDGHVIHLHRKVDLPREICHEDGRAAQHRYEDDALFGAVRVIPRYRGADLVHTPSDVLFGEQYLRNVVVHDHSLFVASAPPRPSHPEGDGREVLRLP